MHGTTVDKARTDSQQVGSSCDPDLIPASLTGSTLRAVGMARPTANLRPGTGSGVGGSNGAAAASAAQLNFYEELCNRQLYRSSLHNLLTSCGGSGSPAGNMSTGLPSVEARCLTLGRYPVAPGSSSELQRRAASVAALTTGRPEMQACAMSAFAATGSGSPPRWSHVPQSATRAGCTEATHALPHAGLPALEGTPSLPFGQLSLLPPPPAAAVATAAAAGMQQRAAIHRRARSMDESAGRHQKRNDAVAASGATAVSAAVASATPAPVAQLPAAADRLHSSQATVAEQQLQQQAATAVKPRPPAAFGGAAFKRSLPDPTLPVASTVGAAPASSSTPTVGVVTAGAQKVVLRKSLSSSIGDRGRSLSCTPLDEKECCLPPPLLPPPPPPAMAASSLAVGGSCSFGEGTAGGSASAVAKTQGAAGAAVAAAQAHLGTAVRTLAAAHSGTRQRHAMHVDDSNYVVMSTIHVRSSSGIVEGCANRTSTSSSLSGDRRHSARSLEELSAGGSTQPQLPEPVHSGDRGAAVARDSASGSRAFHPGSGPQPVPLRSCSASSDVTDKRAGSASNATVHAVGGAGYADNTYENVYRNGMPLCEPVVYANVSSIIRSRAVLTSAAKADLAPAANEGRGVLPPSLPPPPPPATETHHRCCTPPAGASPLSVADGVPAMQSTMAASGALRSGSSTAAGHGEPLLSPTSSVASGSSVFARMPSSCSVSNSSINSCVAVEREAQTYTSSGETPSPCAASSPTEDGERPGSRCAPLYVNVQECLLPSCMPPTGGCGSRSSPRPASPPPELNYAELMHTTPPAMVTSSSGSGSSSGSLARKRQSPCHPPTTLLRGVSSGSGTGSKVDSSSDGVLYAEINIAATEAAHKAQVHQTRYRQEQRNGLRADGGGGGSSAQPTTTNMPDR